MAERIEIEATLDNPVDLAEIMLRGILRECEDIMAGNQKHINMLYTDALIAIETRLLSAEGRKFVSEALTRANKRNKKMKGNNNG